MTRITAGIGANDVLARRAASGKAREGPAPAFFGRRSTEGQSAAGEIYAFSRRPLYRDYRSFIEPFAKVRKGSTHEVAALQPAAAGAQAERPATM